MIDIQAIMQISANITSSSSSNIQSSSSNDSSYNSESFSSAIDKINTAIQEGNLNETQVAELKEAVTNLTNIVNLFDTDEEEIDLEALMELFAGLNNCAFDIAQVQNVEQVDTLISQITTQDVVATAGIDVSALTKTDNAEIHLDLSLADTDVVKAGQEDVITEFSVVKSSSESFESQMELFSSQTNKNLNIRNVADQNDGENDVLNSVLMSGAEEPQPTALIQESTTSITPTNPEIYTQVKSAIVENAQTLEVGNNEFTMVLNPESLGEVTVRLINEGGQSTLQIIAASETAAKLINEDLNILRDVFRPMQVEVRNAEIAVVETQGAEMQGFDMNNQQFDRENQNFDQKSFVSYGNNQNAEEEIEDNQLDDDPNNLSIYI